MRFIEDQTEAKMGEPPLVQFLKPKTGQRKRKRRPQASPEGHHSKTQDAKTKRK